MVIGMSDARSRSMPTIVSGKGSGVLRPGMVGLGEVDTVLDGRPAVLGATVDGTGGSWERTSALAGGSGTITLITEATIGSTDFTSGRAVILARMLSSRSLGGPGRGSSVSTWVGSTSAAATVMPESGPPFDSSDRTLVRAVPAMVTRAVRRVAARATAATVSTERPKRRRMLVAAMEAASRHLMP
jgi:hypothetical protein